MELLLIRHARPERIEGVQGADPALDETGVRQADALASWLSDERVDAIYASPMRRAVETAAPLAAAVGHTVHSEDDICEFDRGFDFYIPMEEMKKENHPHWQTLMSGDWSDVPGNIFEFRDRVVACIDGIAANNRGARVAVVCHGGVINAYAGNVLGIEAPLFFEPEYTGISRVLVSSGGVRSIASLNEASHLRGL
jgi:broad specificity phosphatase PhoE